MCSTRARSFTVTLGFASASAALWAALISIRVFAHAPMDCACASTGVKSRMKSVAATLLRLLQLLRPRLLKIIAVALAGEIAFILLTAGNETFSPLKSASVKKSPELAERAQCRVRTCDLSPRRPLYPEFAL